MQRPSRRSLGRHSACTGKTKARIYASFKHTTSLNALFVVELKHSHDDFRYLLKALDMFWHEDCLKCGCCDCRLGEVGSTLYIKANLILCKRDYLR